MKHNRTFRGIKIAFASLSMALFFSSVGIFSASAAPPLCSTTAEIAYCGSYNTWNQLVSPGGSCICPPPPSSATACPLPWGGSVDGGNSVTAHFHSGDLEFGPYPPNCHTQTRTCTNGQLSGSYINSGSGGVERDGECIHASGGQFNSQTCEYLTADKTVLAPGETTTLHGSCLDYTYGSGRTTYSLNRGDLEYFSVPVPSDGSRQQPPYPGVSPHLMKDTVVGPFTPSGSSLKSYTLYCQSTVGMFTIGDGTCSQGLRIAGCSAPTAAISIVKNGSVTWGGQTYPTYAAEWSSTGGATSCKINGPSGTPFGPYSPSVGPSGRQNLGVRLYDTTLTIQCSGPDGSSPPASAGIQVRGTRVSVTDGSGRDYWTYEFSPETTFSVSSTPNAAGKYALSWGSSADATSCSSEGAWTNAGTRSGSGLSNSVSSATDTPLNFRCTDASGLAATQSVTVYKDTASCPAAPVSVLQLCRDGIPFAVGGQTRGLTLNLGASTGMKTYFDTTPDCAGTDVTGTTNFTDTASPVVTVSPAGSNPNRVTGNSVPTASNAGQQSASERVVVSHGGETINLDVTVLEVCNSSCPAEVAQHCAGQSFTATNSCGASEACMGTRSCDFNWKEVAP